MTVARSCCGDSHFSWSIGFAATNSWLWPYFIIVVTRANWFVAQGANNECVQAEAAWFHYAARLNLGDIKIESVVINNLNTGKINPASIRKMLNKLRLLIANVFILSYKATGRGDKQSITTQISP